MQINRCLYLSNSLWEIPLRCDLFWKRIDPKNFLLTETTELYQLLEGLYIFFAPNSPISWIRLTEKREGEKEEGYYKLLCVRINAVTLPASKTWWNANVQQVILNVIHIFLTRINFWNRILWKMSHYFTRRVVMA